MKIIRKNLFCSNKISPNLEKFSKFGVIFPVSNISPNLEEIPIFEWMSLKKIFYKCGG